ncbi:MAG: RsmD family RNA methyltransferase [Weeksellaceae bacterium]|nr:RsmD family RNA methyltransferase [Weeksellaceae bacterium]
MRIISGLWKGKRLLAPRNLPTRPTTDFAKEALFNILNHRFFLNEVDVLDLFAGIGGVSFEFASREANSIWSVEQNAICTKFLYNTIDQLNIDQMNVIRQDVYKFLLKSPPREFDIIFADPPFESTKEENYAKLVDLIFSRRWLAASGLLIIEHGPRTNLSSLPHYTDQKKYGNLIFSFFEYDESEWDDDEEE